MKRLYKKEFIERMIAGAERVIANGMKTPGKAIKDTQHFIDTYNKYPFAYLESDGCICIARNKLKE
jgi:hypothetical protein